MSCACPGAVPAGTSSSPVASSATRGRFPTRRPSRPSAAATPMSMLVSACPGRITVSPARMSAPRGRTLVPSGAATAIRTTAPSRDVSSWRTTVSAPAGMGAPVMIRIAVPAACAPGTVPARDSPTTGSRTGASTPAAEMSLARTAYPSMAELSNPGSSNRDEMASARIRPSAASRLTVSGSSTPTLSSRRRCALATDSRSVEAACVNIVSVLILHPRLGYRRPS